MANRKRNIVSISVDKSFFENSFEPARKRMQKKLGITNLGQAKFTKIIDRGGLKLDIKLNQVGLKDVFKKSNKRKKR